MLTIKQFKTILIFISSLSLQAQNHHSIIGHFISNNKEYKNDTFLLKLFDKYGCVRELKISDNSNFRFSFVPLGDLRIEIHRKSSFESNLFSVVKLTSPYSNCYRDIYFPIVLSPASVAYVAPPPKFIDSPGSQFCIHHLAGLFHY